MADDNPKSDVHVFHRRKVRVEVWCGDISKVKTNVVVIEDNGQPRDNLPDETKLIYKAITVLQKIPKEKSDTEGIEITRTGGLQSKFDCIFHAAVKLYTNEDSEEWIKSMNQLYADMFKIANARNFRSMSMSLLSGGAPIKIAAETMIQSIAAYTPRTLLEFNIVTLERQTTNEIVSLCTKLFPDPTGTSQNSCSKPKTSEDFKKQQTLVRTNARLVTQNLKEKNKDHVAGANDERKNTSPGAIDRKFDHRDKSNNNSPVKTTDNNIPSRESNVDTIGGSKTTKSGQGCDFASNGTASDREHTSEKPDDDRRCTAHKEEEEKGDEKEGNEGKEFEAGVANQDEHSSKEAEEEDAVCVICMDTIVDEKKLDKCGHTFCRSCIDTCFQTFKPICPSCNTVYGVIMGDQPPGSIYISKISESIPGCGNCGGIMINYSFRNGIQSRDHPHPGKPYYGTQRTAYLPDNTEGNKVSRLLQIAFDRKLTFTVGRSATTGMEDVVIWNDIHHKTSIHGGPQGFGYPDATYLTRVQEELASKGVTEESINS